MQGVPCYNGPVKLNRLHSWQVAPTEAMELQRLLAPSVSRVAELPDPIRYVAGVDISPPDADGVCTGAVVVLAYPSLEVVEVRVHRERPAMPYVPGLLSFRETPVLAGALEALAITPDLLLVDGQGLAHPRRFGIACHLGLLTGLPAVGCAKSLLVGVHGPLGDEAGAWAELVDRGEVVGAALRTRTGVTPVYVSIGHRMDLGQARRWTLACCTRYRLPEPTRLAHPAAAGTLQPSLS
ncbi:MAG: deoxyribonuclease V [Chloroflexota bacterium]|nr:deoxyribonuclease V [Chloroflexota bacterium]